MNNNEIKALISLLDDPDAEVVNEVTDNLTKKGPNIIPELEKAWDTTYNEVLQERLENVIHNIQLYFTGENLKRWIRDGAENILEGAFYIAQCQFPDISINGINDEIDKIHKDVWLEINNNLTAFEKVKILNYFMFDIYNYSINTIKTYSPQNYYINQVIKTKKGSPVTLSIIYLAVSRKLDLPISGLYCSKNLVLSYKDEHAINDDGNKFNDILFYINPNDNCAIIDKHEINSLISDQLIENEVANKITCSNIDILIRLTQNLIHAYKMSGSNDTAVKFMELLKILEQGLK